MILKMATTFYLEEAATVNTAQKMKFLRISLVNVNVTKYAVSYGLVTFNEEIFNEKLHFLYSDSSEEFQRKVLEDN